MSDTRTRRPLASSVAKKAGVSNYIVKPFKPEQLIAVVKKVLG